MSLSYARPAPASSAPDEALVAIAIQGEMSAFEELYHRYAQRAWWVARRVTDNDEDARDAVAEAFAKVLGMLKGGSCTSTVNFGPYVLVATHHAAVDLLRRNARVAPSRDPMTLDSPSTFCLPAAHVEANEERRLVTEALAALSAREQRVLWMLEVEDASLRTAAAVVGVKPNHAAQIAMRARQRLRRAYARAYLRDTSNAACAFTVERLPSYLGDGLSRHAVERVNEHLAACAQCRRRLEELRDLGLTLRHALALPLLLGARAPKWWPRRRRGGTPPSGSFDAAGPISTQAASGAVSTVTYQLAPGANSLASFGAQLAETVGAAAPALQHFVAAASATLLVLGLSAVRDAVDPSPVHPTEQRQSQEMQSGPAVAAGAGTLPVGQAPSATIVVTSSNAPLGGSAVVDPPPVTPGPPAEVGPSSATGLERASETPAGANGPEVTPGPPADAGPPSATGLERASETPAGARTR